jgi:hypothetical protein
LSLYDLKSLFHENFLLRYIDQDEDHDTAEKLKDLELDIEDAVEKTVRTVEKIASLSRTISNIR